MAISEGTLDAAVKTVHVVRKFARAGMVDEEVMDSVCSVVEELVKEIRRLNEMEYAVVGSIDSKDIPVVEEDWTTLEKAQASLKGNMEYFSGVTSYSFRIIQRPKLSKVTDYVA